MDRIRLNELTNTATHLKIREFVLRCYNEEDVETEDGVVQKHLVLNDLLSEGVLAQLYNMLDSIGYFNLTDSTLASVKGLAKDTAGRLFNSILDK